MKEQNRVLNQYFELYGKVTLKRISKDTGIQITRVFRIINGCEMKLNEYLAFEEQIQKKLGSSAEVKNSIINCIHTLSPRALENLKELIDRKFLLWNLCH